MIKRDDPNYKSNGISFVRSDQGADKQFEYFVPNYSQGITYAGLARINQSIEAYCYCILGAQARTRNTIHSVSSGAIETQREFFDRIEDFIVLKEYMTHFSSVSSSSICIKNDFKLLNCLTFLKSLFSPSKHALFSLKSVPGTGI